MTATPLSLRPDTIVGSPLEQRSELLADHLDANARVAVRKAGTLIGIRRNINFHEGTSVGLTVADDPTNEEIDVTVTVPSAAPSGSAGGVLDGTYPNPGLAASVAGAGLAETSDVLSVNAGTGLEIDSDALRIAAAAAGSGLTGGAGSALAVGDGYGTLVNADSIDVDLAMIDTTPAVDQTIPADYAAYVPGNLPYTIPSGNVLTIESGGVLEVGQPTVSLVPRTSSYRTALSTGSTSSTSYVNIPGTSVQTYFRKQRDDTNLIVFCGLSVFYDSSANFQPFRLGVNVNGTDYDCDSFIEIGANYRGSMYGPADPIAGLPAGLIRLCQRIKATSGTFNCDANGTGSILVTESF